MTASTAPITLPARHRQEQAPTWWFHRFTGRLQRDVTTIDRRGRRHLVVLVLGAGLVSTAATALVALPLP